MTVAISSACARSRNQAYGFSAATADSRLHSAPSARGASSTLRPRRGAERVLEQRIDLRRQHEARAPPRARWCRRARRRPRGRPSPPLDQSSRTRAVRARAARCAPPPRRRAARRAPDRPRSAPPSRSPATAACCRRRSCRAPRAGATPSRSASRRGGLAYGQQNTLTTASESTPAEEGRPAPGVVGRAPGDHLHHRHRLERLRRRSTSRCVSWPAPIRIGVRSSLTVLRRLDVDRDGDVVADHDAAAVQRLAPVDPEVLAVDLRGGVRPGARLAHRVLDGRRHVRRRRARPPW